MNPRALALALLWAAASAADPTPAPPQNVVRSTSALPDGGAPIWYVDGRGSDTNTCASPFTDGGKSGPCATPQGAVNKIPRSLKHLATVMHAEETDGGPRNYPGFIISGFTCDPPQLGSGGLLFTGNLVTPSGSFGDVPSGTATSGAAGSGSTFGTITQTGKVFTTNVLRGYLIETLSGSGSGQVRVVSSNTADTVTIVGTWTAPASGTTYAIRVPGWNINTAAPQPANGIGAIINNTGAIIIHSNNCTFRSGSVAIKNVGLSNTSGAGVVLLDSISSQIFQARAVGLNGPGISGFTGASGRLQVTDFSFTAGATSISAVSMLSPVAAGLSRVLAYGTNFGLWNSTPGIVSPGFSCTSCEANNSTTGGFVVGSSAGGRNLISSTRIDCASSAGVGVIVGVNSTTATFSFTPSFAVVELSGVVMGGTCGTGVSVSGPLAMVGTTSLSGTAATNGFMANWGGRVYAFGSTTLTGGTRDVNLDNGAVSAALGDITNCQISDGGFSKYNSMFCKP